MPRSRSFPPVVGDNPRILILGSLPGVESLRRGEYYAHLQNKFWELLGAALDENLRALEYAERIERLKARGIALWDVIAEARRDGSLDADIMDIRPNDVAGFIRREGVRAIFFNGRKAEASFRVHFEELPSGVQAVSLPSSSPANASIPWPRKLAAWREIRRILDDIPA